METFSEEPMSAPPAPAYDYDEYGKGNWSPEAQMARRQTPPPPTWRTTIPPRPTTGATRAPFSSSNQSVQQVHSTMQIRAHATEIRQNG